MALGKFINAIKSFMIISPSARDEHMILPQGIFLMKMESSFGKYLRVPVIFVKSKKFEFNFLVEKIKRKL